MNPSSRQLNFDEKNQVNCCFGYFSVVTQFRLLLPCGISPMCPSQITMCILTCLILKLHLKICNIFPKKPPCSCSISWRLSFDLGPVIILPCARVDIFLTGETTRWLFFSSYSLIPDRPFYFSTSVLFNGSFSLPKYFFGGPPSTSPLIHRHNACLPFCSTRVYFFADWNFRSCSTAYFF